MRASPHVLSDREKKATALGFTETRWSLVALAGSSDSSGSREALAKLCESYWHPIYSFLRHKGNSSHDAEDFTQQFFVRLLTENAFVRADQTKGRFRSFLLGALKNFIIDDYRRSTSLKRGGEMQLLPFDLREAESSYREEPDSNLTPEQVYDQRWAARLLNQALVKLRSEFEAAGHQNRFEHLKGFLSGEARRGEYEKAGEQIDLTAKSTKMAVYRLRQRYQQLVRAEVADTLEDSNELDDELQHLFG
jgi:RNA polymerase sigma factor (sigma-70 family)